MKITKIEETDKHNSMYVIRQKLKKLNMCQVTDSKSKV